MRQIVSISLPQNLANLVDNTVAVEGYASKSEFFRELLRNWADTRMLFELNKSREEIINGKGKTLKSLKDLR